MRQELPDKVNHDRLVDIKAAARFLGFSADTMGRKVREGSVPHIRIGRTLRFRLSELEAWIARQSVAVVSQSDEDAA